MPFLGAAFPAAIARRVDTGENHALPHPADTPPRSLELARRVLRRYREGMLLADGVPHARRFVFDPKNGELILRVGRDELLAEESVLHVPEEEAPGADAASVQLLLDMRETDSDRDGACDRHAAAHPRDDAPAWARARIESGRLAGEVFGGADLVAPNAIAGDERSLLRTLNNDADALRLATRRLTGVGVEDPLAVAADRFGFDVRAAFGVVRAEFDRPASDAADALEQIRALLDTPH